MQSVQLDISGMSCNHCVKAVSTALRQLAGVTDADVEIGHAKVTLDPMKASIEQLLDAVDDAGFAANVA